VERIVGIPLRHLLEPERYIRYRLTMPAATQTVVSERVREVPAFCVPSSSSPDILWGATYRITMAFLQTVFGFSPPTMENLPLVYGHLGRSYFTAER
jgi:hypothetical protein